MTLYKGLTIKGTTLVEKATVKGKSGWLCRCSCDDLFLITSQNLHGYLWRESQPKCRKCVYDNKIDWWKGRRKKLSKNEVGNTYGEWTVISYVESKNRSTYLCRCSCGTEKVTTVFHMRNGSSQSCGCKLRKFQPDDVVGKRFGDVAVFEYLEKQDKYDVYCYSCRKPSRKSYDWIREFVWNRQEQDLIHCGCRQARGIYYTLNGKTLNISGWARELGISREAVRLRLKKFPLEEALTKRRGKLKKT